MTYLLVMGGVLKFPTTTMLESIYSSRSLRVFLMKLGTLMLDAYRLIIIISFCCICPFISMECPSLSYLSNISLKSTLSEISMLPSIPEVSALGSTTCPALGSWPITLPPFSAFVIFPISAVYYRLPYKGTSEMHFNLLCEKVL
jgi:hypothetical protein